MKYMTLYSLTLFISISVYSQDLKKVTKTLFPELKESYYVLKKDTKIKHGKYSMAIEDDTIRYGFYNNNNKSGIWKYYYYKDRKLEFIYDYDQNIIVSDTIGKERPALYSEGHEYFEYLRAKNTEYPPESIIAGHSGRVIISFSVNIDGSVSDFSVYMGCGDLGLNNEALRVIKKIALLYPWYPAVNAKGEKIKSTLTKPVIYMLQ